MKYRAEVLREEDYGYWDRFVGSHDCGTFFHSANWLSRFGYPLTVQVLRDRGGTIVGGYALVRSRRLRVAGFHIPPFTPWFGPVVAASERATSAAAFADYQNRLSVLLEALPNTGHYDFRLFPGDTDLLPYIWRGFQPTVEYTFEIPPPSEGPGRGLASRKRRLVQLAWQEVEYERLRIDEGGSLEEFLPLARATASLQRFALPERLIRRLFREDERDSRWKLILVRDTRGSALAGLVILLDRDRMYGEVNGAVLQVRNSKGLPSLLTFEQALKVCAERDLVFDFRGSSLPGIANHFSMLGGIQRACCRLQKTRSGLYYAARSLSRYVTERRQITRSRRAEPE